MSKYHAVLSGTDLHDPKLHASYHEVGGVDLIDHNNLNAIDGGASAEYYHLTQADYDEVTGWLAAVTAGTD